MTNATYTRTVTADAPDYANADILFTLLSSVAIASPEIFPGKTYTMDLDADGLGSIVLPTPDNTGDAAWLWEVVLPDGRDKRVTLAYDASSVTLATLLLTAVSSVAPDDIQALLDGYIPKVNPATAGNLPLLLADGTLEDAGVGSDALIPKIDPAVAGDLVIQAVGGTLVGAGYAAVQGSSGVVSSGSVVRRDDVGNIVNETNGGSVSIYGEHTTSTGVLGRSAGNGVGIIGLSVNGNGAESVSINGAYHHAFGVVSAIARLTGILSFLGASADANRAAQRREILAADQRPAQIDIAGTTHTFTTANENQIVSSQSGSATTFTIPLNSAQAFPVGSIVGIEQQGAGVLTIEATAGVTLNGVDGNSVAISAQWGAAAIRKISTNGWVIVGAIS